MPILLAVIATYEFYRQNNKKLDWGEILPYFSGALLLMVVFELLLVSLFFNDTYTNIIKSLPDWNFIIAIFSLSLAVLIGYGGKVSTKKDLKSIQNELREIKSYMKDRKDENMTKEERETTEKKKSLISIWDKFQQLSINRQFLIEILILIFIVAILYGVLFYYGFYLITDSYKIFIQLGISVIIPLLFVHYTFHKANELRFLHALGNLVDEMIQNTSNLTDEAFNDRIEKLENKIQKNEWVGFEKFPSLTDWSDNDNFYQKYLPTTKYF
jgi:hypothetical protein